MSRRTDQIAGMLREEIQQVIARGLQDPRIRGLITITRVEVIADLTRSTAYLSVFPQEHAELTMHGLRSSAKHIRRKVGDATALSRVPEILFEFDRGSINQVEVIEALAAARQTELDLRAELKAQAEASGSSDDLNADPLNEDQGGEPDEDNKPTGSHG